MLFPSAIQAGEGPFFITYTHQMEEPGNLEMSTKAVTGSPGGGNRFFGAAAELEYGIKAWWTTELYLDGQGTVGDSTIFTGYRWENRFRIVPGEHWINPVLYLEFENINGADKTLKELVGFDGKDSQSAPNSEARLEHESELETKLILSSLIKGWNVSENFIGAKNIHGGSWVYENVGFHSFARRRVFVDRIVGDLAALTSGPKPGAKVVSTGAAELFGTEFGGTK